MLIDLNLVHMDRKTEEKCDVEFPFVWSPEEMLQQILDLGNDWVKVKEYSLRALTLIAAAPLLTPVTESIITQLERAHTQLGEVQLALYARQLLKPPSSFTNMFDKPSKNYVREDILSTAIHQLSSETPPQILEFEKVKRVASWLGPKIFPQGEPDLTAALQELQTRLVRPKRNASDLLIVFLCDASPSNDVEVLLRYGVALQNIYAITADENTASQAGNNLKEHGYSDVNLVCATLEAFLKLDNHKMFDIIYFDSCGLCLQIILP